jgi:hypothetical protein
MKVEKEDRILSASRDDIDVLKGYMSNIERSGSWGEFMCATTLSTKFIYYTRS